MVAALKQPTDTAARPSRTAQALTLLTLVASVVACLGGLFIPGLYRFAPFLVTATQGQDLVTLVVAVPGAGLGLLAARNGSARGNIIWIGLLGYLTYAFVGAAFAYDFAQFFLVYVAGLSLSVFTLITAFGGIQPSTIESHFDAAAPRRSVAVFQLVIAALLSLLWLSRIIPNLTNPDPVAVESYKFVYALDLGFVVPLSVLGAIWLWLRKPWGYLLSGMMLIKYATMGLALLAMQVFNVRAGQPTDPIELVASYTLIAVGGLGMSAWFLRHCRR